MKGILIRIVFRRYEQTINEALARPNLEYNFPFAYFFDPLVVEALFSGQILALKVLEVLSGQISALQLAGFRHQDRNVATDLGLNPDVQQLAPLVCH